MQTMKNGVECGKDPESLCAGQCISPSTLLPLRRDLNRKLLCEESRSPADLGTVNSLYPEIRMYRCWRLVGTGDGEQIQRGDHVSMFKVQYKFSV